MHFCTMFDFEKLIVYQEAKSFNTEIRNEILSLHSLDRTSRDQLRRAAMSVMLNIAEGTSRFTKADKRHFYIVSRGSLFECIAISDLLESEKIISRETKMKLYTQAEVLSRMLFSMIRTLGQK